MSTCAKRSARVPSGWRWSSRPTETTWNSRPASQSVNERMSSTHFLWRMRPYARHVAGELVLGAVFGIIINTAVVVPALLLRLAVGQVVGLSPCEHTAPAFSLRPRL